MFRRRLVRSIAVLGGCSVATRDVVQCIETPKEKHDWMRAPTEAELKELTNKTLPAARIDAANKNVPLPAALRAAERALGNLPPIGPEGEVLPTFTAREVAAMADDHFVCVTHGEGVYNVTDFVK